ncbi:MAG: DUF3488 domain-containing protein [Planctomycetales bacterium]|nr:DUF3488 domain-containing protein [Planctomycetales bacterium]
MDITKVKQLRRNLTLHFAVIAWLTAMLVAAGSESFFLPSFIFLVSVAAFIFVDVLEWFEVGRIGSYILMGSATLIAIATYIYSAFYSASESGQLMAVASLLVYPEAVLFLQKKNLRVFEQLAVFLLLEMVVAALVNDNILFGVLLTPIMLIWVSSLFLFARYATLVHVDASIESPIPHLSELLFQRFKKRVLGTSQRRQLLTTRLVTSKHVQGTRLSRRLLQSIPIGVGAITFSGFFFYLMPRTSTGSLRRPLGSEISMGIPKNLAMGEVGRLKQDPSPVMRVTFRNADKGGNYSLIEAPYLRARIMDTYLSSRSPLPDRKSQWVFTGTHWHRPLPPIDRVLPLRDTGRELVRVDFDIRRQYLPTMYAVHSTYEIKKKQALDLKYDKSSALMEEISQSAAPAGKAITYRIGCASFAGGRQLPIAPVDPGDSPREIGSFFRNRGLLSANVDQFVGIEDYWRRVIQSAGVAADDSYRVARTLERHFLDSGEFQYSLDLTLPEANMDPIEDFVVNKKVGHCQYYAAALLVMMRQAGIPGRIIVGYHPHEFNERGKYFAVRQSDAHAWVEGLFDRDQLVGTELERWLTDAREYWVHFDPTPAPDGLDEGIVQQPGQTLDYAEKLWKDYVTDPQTLDNENSLYAPVAENSKNAYENLIKQLEAIKDRVGGANAGSVGFAWPITIVVILIGGTVVGVWRLIVWLPRLSPKLAKRLGVGRNQLSISQTFYARCVAILQNLGIQYSPSDTAVEYTQRAADWLQNAGAESPQGLRDSLRLLANHYYNQRFGAAELTPQNETEIQSALGQLELAAEKVGK